MEIRISKIFSFAATEKDYFKDNQNKIEIVSCARNEIKCKKQLLLINKSYLESEKYRRNKDYPRSIETLKNAFYNTKELKDNPFQKCSLFFQQTISNSLYEIKGELKKLTSGIFAKKYYQPSLVLASQVIEDLEKVSLSSEGKSKELKNPKINNYIKKNAV